MTPEQLELERQAFEAYYNELKGFGSLERVGDTYAYSHPDYAWQSWLARAQQSAWISVEDRQPELNKEVLVVLSDGEIGFAQRINDELESQIWDINNPNLHISHWQPLPEPPKAA